MSDNWHWRSLREKPTPQQRSQFREPGVGAAIEANLLGQLPEDRGPITRDPGPMTLGGPIILAKTSVAGPMCLATDSQP